MRPEIVPALIVCDSGNGPKPAPRAGCVPAKVDRALRAGALAMGAKVRTITVPGYIPLEQDPQLNAIFRANAAGLVGDTHIATAAK